MNRSIASGGGQPGARPALERGWPSAALAARGRTPRRPVPLLVRRALLFFILTIPFEQITLAGFISPAKISGLLFFGCCFWYPKTCFPRPAPAVLWFIGYLAIVLFLGLFIPRELRRQLVGWFLTVAQLVTFFWVCSSLLQETRLARQSLLAFGAASSLLAVGTLLQVPGIAGTIHSGELRGGTRATALGYNPNDLAGVMAMAAVMLIGLLLDNTRRTRMRAWLLVGMTAPLLALLVGTGSRGGLLAFVFAASLFLVPLAPSRRRIAAFWLGIFAMIALGVMVSRDPMSAARWTETYREGNVAGRDVIFKKAAQMFVERPILGWGPVELTYELGSRLNLPTRDTHNLYLWLLLEVGIVGTIFFMAGFWLCGRGAWKSRTGPEGILPLALFVIVVVVNFSGTWIGRKPMWLIMAIAIASPAVSAHWQRAVWSGRRLLPGRPLTSSSARRNTVRTARPHES